MIKTSHLSHPSLLHIEMNTSHSDDKLMPEPSNLNDPRWKSLPSLLNDSVLARFDQSRCTNNHGIHERAMCFGLSLSWLEKVKKDGSHANHYAAAERMNYLASFDGVVNSRILHNFYRHEHAFQIKLATASGDISKASLAGTESLIQAAEYKNIKLKPRLENQLSKDMPFLTMVKTSERYLKDDDAAFDTFNSALADAKRGIMAIYSHEGSHALGFSKSENGKKLILDPNNGEFEFHKNDFKEMINKFSAISGLPMVGLQIFNAE